REATLKLISMQKSDCYRRMVQFWQLPLITRIIHIPAISRPFRLGVSEATLGFTGDDRVTSLSKCVLAGRSYTCVGSSCGRAHSDLRPASNRNADKPYRDRT